MTNLTPDERRQWDGSGFLVREAVFSPREVADLQEVAEEVAQRVLARATRVGAGPEALMADGHRIQFSSQAAIQWEWAEGSRAIRVLEPCDHLHPALAGLFDDDRLAGPVAELLGCDTVAPFTCKLNMKRALEGSEFPWHQDYPYWYVAVEEAAADVATAVVFLDDAIADNGALRVLAGSHQAGPARRDPADPSGFLADPKALGGYTEITVEVPAGSVVFFGAYLIHRSSPNRSARHRRAILPSFQPAGRPRLHDVEYRRELVSRLP